MAESTIREPIKGLLDEQGIEKKVEVDVRPIPVHAELDFDNLFGRYTVNQDQTEMGGNLPIGSGKMYALRYGLVALYVDDEKVDFPEQNPSRGFPPLRDKERESIITKVVMVVVKHNKWLGQIQPYMGVFQPFLLALKAAEEEDSPNGSGGPAAVTSGIVENPTDSSKSGPTSPTSTTDPQTPEVGNDSNVVTIQGDTPEV